MKNTIRWALACVPGLLFPCFLLAQTSAHLHNNVQLASISVPVHHNPEKLHLKARGVLGLMHQHIYAMRAHSYRLKVEERRLGDKVHEGEMLISVKQAPLYVRLEILSPNKGAMVEYNAARDKRNALVTPRKWLPAFNFRRDIHGSLLRPGHYAITETSLNHIDGIIRQSEAQLRSRGIYEKSLRYWGQIQVEGRLCHKIELIDPDYHLYDYQVQKGEDLLSIARDKVINPYKIKELNPRLTGYFDVEAGQIIRLPSSFSRRCLIYVEVETHLPRKLEIYDEKGCFERYRFLDIQVEK